MPVSTVKAAASTGLVGSGGIIGTTIPSVNLSSVKAENEELTQKNQQLEQDKENIEKSQSREISKRLMQYQWKYNYGVTNHGEDGVQPFGTELTLAFHNIKDKFNNPKDNAEDKCDADIKALLQKLPKEIKDVTIG